MIHENNNIIIVDYDIGNVASVANMLEYVGAESLVSSDPEIIKKADKIILPGVGAFDAGMAALNRKKIDIAIKDAVSNGSYLLGICLGAQLLLESSEEGKRRGLGLIPGKVKHLRVKNQGLRVPHMGWNNITPKNEATLLKSDDKEIRFYFAHSYYPECQDEADIAATCFYGYEFTCALERNRVLGAQFHPEKSHKFGMNFFKRFKDL